MIFKSPRLRRLRYIPWRWRDRLAGLGGFVGVAWSVWFAGSIDMLWDYSYGVFLLGLFAGAIVGSVLGGAIDLAIHVKKQRRNG